MTTLLQVIVFFHKSTRKYRWSVPNVLHKTSKNKLSIDEAIQCSLDFAIEYEKKRNRAMKGLPDKWDSPKRGRRPTATNDGKPTERSFKVIRRTSSSKEDSRDTPPSTNIQAEQIIVPAAEPPVLTKGPD